MSKSKVTPTPSDVRAWYHAAKANDWACKATYGNEPEDSYATLKKGQFTAMVNMRVIGVNDVKIWGPDGLAIEPRFPYRWEDIAAGILMCSECDHVGETVRLAFANRVCRACREKLKATYERPGWAD